MADNVAVKDATGTSQQIRTKDRSGVHYQITERPAVSSYVNLDLDENGVSVLGTAGQVHSAEIFNSHSDPVFVKLYNKSSAPASSDTPLRVWEVMPGGPAFRIELEHGIDCPLGIGLRCTTGRPHNDNVGPPTNTCLMNLGYRLG